MNKRVKWTAKDQQKALRDGWGVFCSDSKTPDIERFDTDPEHRFDSDEEASGYVLKRARRHSLERRAVRFVCGL